MLKISTFSANIHVPFEKKVVVEPPGSSKRIGDYLVVRADGSIYKVFEKITNNSWRAHPVNVLPYRPGMGVTLPWHLVGIHR